MTPEGIVSKDTFFPSTYYLVSVNEKYHREYAQTPAEWD